MRMFYPPDRKGRTDSVWGILLCTGARKEIFEQFLRRLRCSVPCGVYKAKDATIKE